MTVSDHLTGTTQEDTRAARASRALHVFGAITLTALILYPLTLSSYQMDIARDALIFALLALSLDFLWGKTGILSFGQAAYFGIGAYAVGIVGPMISGDNAALVGLAAGIGIALAVSGVVGYFLIFGGVRGAYLTIVTLALTLVTRNIATSWASVTGGEAGLIGAPLPGIALGSWSIVADDSMSQYLLVATILVLALVIIWLACRGQYGRILAAIQDNEQKAQSLGYNTSAHLLFVFMTSGGLAALSGALYASLAGYVAPDLVGLLLTTQAIIHVALGGRGSLIGPVLATVFVIRLQQTVSSYSYALWPLMLGVFFIAIVFVFPDGILGPIRKLFDAFAKGRGVRR